MCLPVTDSPAQVSLSEAVEIAAAVRMVRTLRAELGTEHGTVQRVASQFSYGPSRCGRGVRQSSRRRSTLQTDQPVVGIQ